MTKRVAILGGGVGGMSAAHELCERGFEVEVFESRRRAGGKARSIPVPGTGQGGRPNLPGEHGFRFFPGFYKHLPDTMKRIPFGHNRHGVYDNLVQASEYLVAEKPGRNFKFLVRFPESIGEWREAFQTYLNARAIGVPKEEVDFFVEMLLVILTSCRERRLAEYERQNWWDFIAAPQMSPAYRTYLARGLTRSLVAMRAETASARTVGDIFLQLVLDAYAPGVDLDRVLNGPTSEKWLDPWLAYLEQRGVKYKHRTTVSSVHCSGGRITHVTVVGPDGIARDVTSDYYVSALPVEQLVPLLTPEMIAADASLGHIRHLQVAWMNGVQVFLKDDSAFAEGHVNFVESRWALTAISQQQFWPRSLKEYGNGTASGCFSVDISDWESPGIIYGQPAREVDSREKVIEEVLAQMRAALDPSAAAALDPSNIDRVFLDPDIVIGSGPTRNLEPLLINVAGSWKNRPEAATAIPNFVLAADYVRTYTDLATMEAANEAARRAVNVILAHSGTFAEPCNVWRLEEPLLFAPLREYDLLRYKMGLSNALFGKIHPPHGAVVSPPAALPNQRALPTQTHAVGGLPSREPPSGD